MSDRLRLVAWSFLMLFVEIALIRWSGENLVYLSYFSNFVLLGSFLGIGIGFLRAGRRRPISQWTTLALLLYAMFVVAFPAKVGHTGSGLIYFGEFTTSGLPAWLVLPIVFIAVAAIMAVIADGVARAFAKFPPIEAYRLDILGAVAGTAGFTVLAFLNAPPLAWGVIAVALAIGLTGVRFVPIVAGAALIAVLAVASLTGDLWSPYYRITVAEEGNVTHIGVNGIPHQAITSADLRLELEPIYQVPYAQYAGGTPESVLVIGAGNGTDVAIALANGVSSVDAVEIDPVLQALGRERHPDQPYADPRVEVVIDDGRAFIERTNETYDMILYALPDSLTLVSGQANLRLESYLFTEESLRRVRSLLNDDGMFAMYNYYREPWLIDRLALMVGQAFDTEPCVSVIQGDGGLAVITTGAINCTGDRIDVAGLSETAATDDHPFLYVRDRTIPALYLITVALIVVLSVAAVRFFGGPLRRMTTYIDLFFMGAAFLLLETKTIVQFSLLFGSTWLVNALVFMGILLSVLAAIEVAKTTWAPQPTVLYSALFISLAVAWAVPLGSFLGAPVGLRFLAGTAVAFTPVFIANIIFARRFKDTASSTTAFGVNLLGAMVGGALEYLALVVGYRWLAVLVAALYLAAMVAERRLTAPFTTRVSAG